MLISSDPLLSVLLSLRVRSSKAAQLLLPCRLFCSLWVRTLARRSTNASTYQTYNTISDPANAPCMRSLSLGRWGPPLGQPYSRIAGKSALPVVRSRSLALPWPRRTSASSVKAYRSGKRLLQVLQRSWRAVTTKTLAGSEKACRSCKGSYTSCKVRCRS